MQNIIIIASGVFRVLNIIFLVVTYYLLLYKKKRTSAKCALSFALLFSAISNGLQGEFALMIGMGILSVLCFASYLYPEH